MQLGLRTTRRLFPIFLTLALTAGGVTAEVPGEIAGVGFDDPTTLAWSTVAGADTYNVYRGTRSDVLAGVPARCHGFALAGAAFQTPQEPPPGETFVYLVTGESVTDGEGAPGFESGGAPRPLLGGCTPLMRNHVQDRLGFGWDEYTRDRIATLGIEGYIDEQLVPRFISELDNTVLQSALNGIDPPDDIVELIQQQVVRAAYARRQLEQQYAAFWANHFNTDWAKLANLLQGSFPQCQAPNTPPQCDPDYPSVAYYHSSEWQYREMTRFRRESFNANFRSMIEESTFGPAMIFYLDTYASVVGNPNENYPRELMELHTMGVDGGYTQADVEELSRVITGWTLCKKAIADADDPLAPCLPEYWEDEPLGRIVATFVVGQHDCTEKTLFAGTPQEVVIPYTCASPIDGVNDVHIALDAIVGHPSTARYISTKILQRFVTETPTEAQIDALVAVWNDGNNPNGVGDLQALLSAALHLPEFLDPDRVGSKIKTPLEHFVSAVRGVRGFTDGAVGVVNALVATQHIPHYNPVPTGWPEDGASWIGTQNMLERQNFGIQLTVGTIPPFGADPVGLLNDNGVATGPGNAEPIVDFFIDTLFGGALTPAERQAALDFLNTADGGQPSPYDDQRIRQTVSFLLGYPQFMEQ